MSSVVISGDTSGAITLSAPAVAGTNTITLPASTGTVVTTGSPASGNLIQVVQGTTLTPTTTASTSYVQTNLTASITPKFSTSKIMVLVSSAVYFSLTGGYGFYTVYRNNTTNLGTGGVNGLGNASCPFQSNVDLQLAMQVIDSPATTSATTYTVWARGNGVGNAIINDNLTTNSIILLEIAA